MWFEFWSLSISRYKLVIFCYYEKIIWIHSRMKWKYWSPPLQVRILTEYWLNCYCIRSYTATRCNSGSWKRFVATACESRQSGTQPWRTVDGLLWTFKSPLPKAVWWKVEGIESASWPQLRQLPVRRAISLAYVDGGWWTFKLYR